MGYCFEVGEQGKLLVAAILEAQNASLHEQLKTVAPGSTRQDPASWIPGSQPQLSLEAHSASINGVAFHPIFSSLASASDDCTVKIWDWELGELEKSIKAHTQAVRDVDYGGPKGAIVLASCSFDLTIKLWDPADNYNNIRTLSGHQHTITSVRFLPSGTSASTPQGTRLASASADRSIKIWEVASGYCVKTIQEHSDWVRSISPSADGRFLPSASSDKTARLWDTQSPNPDAVQTLIGHDHAVSCCAIAPAASYRHLASLAGPKTTPPLTNSTELFATGSRDRTIKLWDARGRCFASLTGHENWVSALIFHPGGRYILSAADDKTVRVWDLSEKGQCIRVLRGIHEPFLTCLRGTPAVARDVPVRNGDGRAGAVNGDSANVLIRCVIATGSMDTRVKVCMR